MAAIDKFLRHINSSIFLQSLLGAYLSKFSELKCKIIFSSKAAGFSVDKKGSEDANTGLKIGLFLC
jgi:hypothetical protein